MELPEIYVSFRIVSENVTVETIVKSLSLKPDNTWSVGQKRKGTILKEVNNGVEFCSINRGAGTLNDEMQKLLFRLEGAIPALKGLPEECKSQFSCVIYSSATPELYLDESIVAGLARYGASIDVDLYNFDREERTDQK